jgi:UDP-N-acetylmuramoylalanine-D-glutamate ligase
MLQDFSPKLHIGLLNNIYPCHLDWHYDSFNIYREAKVNILRNAENKILS